MSNPLPTKPSFCVISPIAYLEEYSTQSNVHLALAHLVDTNPTYASFYKEMSDRGDFVICDNGAFELGESYNPNKLIELGHKCGADAIVLPDYPGKHSSETIKAAKKLIPQLKDNGFKTFFCPQSEIGSLEDWMAAYVWAGNNPDIDIIGMSILGIPNALPHIPKAYARVVMTELLFDRGAFNTEKYHHYLGLNAGPNVEIPSLIEMGALNSCDSSNPIWCGINDVKYNIDASDCMVVKKKLLPHVDFNLSLVDNNTVHEIIQHNLDITFDIFANHKNYL